MLNFGNRGSGVNPKNFRNDKRTLTDRLKLAGRKSLLRPAGDFSSPSIQKDGAVSGSAPRLSLTKLYEQRARECALAAEGTDKPRIASGYSNGRTSGGRPRVKDRRRREWARTLLDGGKSVEHRDKRLRFEERTTARRIVNSINGTALFVGRA